MARDFELDRAGIGEILRSDEMASAVRAAADAVADNLRARGVADVYVDTYTTDRAAASVTIPFSYDDELKNGRLIDAATVAALDVRSGRF